VTVDPGTVGLSAEVINRAMMDNEPSVRLRAHHTDEDYFTVDAMELTDDEIELTCDRLVGMLNATEAEKVSLMGKYEAEEAVSARWAWLR
jgi:hypothetical protein